MTQPNPIKLKHRNQIREIIRTVIVEKTMAAELTIKIQKLIKAQNIPKEDEKELFNIIETEIMSLHEGNIARFWILPHEFNEWKVKQ